MDLNAKLFVAGGRGLVGSAIVRCLEDSGFTAILSPTSSELDLMDQKAVAGFFKKEKPEYVFLAAAKVGGIMANSTYPADFIHNNLMIQTNILHQSFVHRVKRLLFLGSSCIYPKQCPQPMKEIHLMTGPLEPTNSPYAVAKIAGIEMCWAYNRQHGTRFIPVMPTNLYGPNDNFDLETSHVLPALIRRFHDAKRANAEKVILWGTGSPKREFLYVDDLAKASIHLMNSLDDDTIARGSLLYNIGTGKDITIMELSKIIRTMTGFKGKIEWDSSKPDGTPRKLLDVSRILSTGWQPGLSLKEGLEHTYQWYLGYLAHHA